MTTIQLSNSSLFKVCLGYLEDVEEALDSYPKCKVALEEALRNISQMIWTADGRKKLEEIFQLVLSSLA